jgi:hypothetical protein
MKRTRDRACIIRTRHHVHVLTTLDPTPCPRNLYWHDGWANAAAAKGGTLLLCPNLRPRSGAWCGKLR